MNKRRAILHIGTEKTGTTSIQHVLSRSRAALVERGFAYSVSAGDKNHIRLAAYAGDPTRVDDIRNDLRRVPSAGGPYEQFPEDLAMEMSNLPARVNTVIFSGEHCHSRLLSVESIARLKDLLDPYFSEYLVLVYLRRQDELAISHYSTQLRNGRRHPTLLPPPEDRAGYFDYAAMLERWCEVFGRPAVVPRLYGRSEFVGGDLVQDFLAACGVGPIELPEPAASKNPSLLPAAQEFLRRFNATDIGGPGRPRPRWVYTFIDERFAGPGIKPRKADAKAFVARYAEGNERIRAHYFPTRPTLFSEDFSDYPPEQHHVPESAVLDVAMAVIEHLSAQAPTRPGHPQRPEGPGGGAGRRLGAGGGGGGGRRPRRLMGQSA